MWTLDELVDRVEDALSAEYSGAPNGRVRGIPDRRAVRWYSTIGLVDRPIGMRGRTALYGPRHLLQLVAVKRRQAEGRLLADIQVELSGADDETLAAVARVPAALLAADGPYEDEIIAPRPRFWADTPAKPAVKPAPAPAPAKEQELEPRGTRAGAVQLGGGAILVLPGTPTDDDLAAITAAAAPLLRTLAGRGLLTHVNTEDGSPS
jgi:DNA-binding transcriptional MerR regulator